MHRHINDYVEVESNKRISKSFEETAKKINVAGVSLGDLTSNMTAYINPTTAALSLTGALTAAYAKSSTGAKDMAYSQDRLNFILKVGLDNFVKLVGGGSGEGGTGHLINLFPFGVSCCNTVQALTSSSEIR